VAWVTTWACRAVACRLIQETLVEMGDKEAAFVGSSRWIGAIELSYVLDQLLGVGAMALLFVP